MSELKFKCFDSEGDGQPYAILVTSRFGGNVEDMWLLSREGEKDFWWGDLGLKAAERLVRKLEKTAKCYFPDPNFPASGRSLDYEIIEAGTDLFDFIPDESKILGE